MRHFWGNKHQHLSNILKDVDIITCIKEISELVKKDLEGVDIFFGESMKRHTSFRIGGDADIFVDVYCDFLTAAQICMGYNAIRKRGYVYERVQRKDLSPTQNAGRGRSGQ